jgi:hypothetical protein
MPETKREKIIELLNSISSLEEKEQVKKSEDTRQKVIQTIDAIKPIEKKIEPAKDSSKIQYREMKRMTQIITDGFSELSKALVSKLDEIKTEGYKGSRGQENYALTLQNMAKSIADGLGAVKKSVDDKPTPIWKWPQYLYTGLRNKTFAPINPATDGIGIGDYDYVAVAYPTATSEVYTFYAGGATGTLVSTISLAYTTAAKDVLSTVTKTPLTL